jgi:putative lipoic acid-binding regulatory protein
MIETEERYSKLKTLLDGDKEGFPRRYIFKFVCDNSPELPTETLSFEADCKQLQALGRRESAKGSHVALTYSLQAGSSDEIIAVLKRIEKIRGLRVIL